jgi:hypothetical protein
MGDGIGRNSSFPRGLMSLVPILPLVISTVLRETVKEEVWEVITVNMFQIVFRKLRITEKIGEK